MYRQRPHSRESKSSSHAPSQASERAMQIGLSMTPPQDRIFDACATTAAYFFFAQGSSILCLHHDTLQVERRFNGHQHDVVWIECDNHSEYGAGRLVASYDQGNMTIIWDISTGRTIARFNPIGDVDIGVAAWMRNGYISFGNSDGVISLFEPNTNDNWSRRTIYTQITALAPALDCRTFAIGYITGSILIASLEPHFNILHTLNTQRTPSPINCLGWHGSSKSDMLASQTMDGDLRVWSVPRGPNGEPPAVIRHFDKGDPRPVTGPCWFAWSKAGRIVQYSNGQTTSWDVRTKRVTYESVPTIDGVVGIANFGPNAVLFTVGRNHTVQQYDLSPDTAPMLVRNVQHMPAHAFPSPPHSIERRGTPLDLASDSEGEGGYTTAMDRITRPRGNDPHELSEEGDILAPLSPVSSAASSSRSSRKGGPSKQRKVPSYPTRYERQSSSRLRPQSPGMSVISGSGPKTPNTVFSSSSSTASGQRRKNSGSRKVVQTPARSPNEPAAIEVLFPYIEERLKEVQFRPPKYVGPRTNNLLRQELLKCIFGWDGEVDELIRYEISHHESGSPTSVLLSKWLGEVTDFSSSMMGESMTSSDWMLLALSGIGGESQKKIGDAFVQRLLEKGDIHPAVAILLGLGENNEAIEIYVSRGNYLEATLLACLVTPNDWGRISHLARLLGGQAIDKNDSRQTEIAVRCFACASVESSEPWFSPAAKDAVYEAQMRILGPDLSPDVPSPQDIPNFGPKRTLGNIGLKLNTDFSKPKEKGMRSALDGKTPMVGYTPMDTSIPDTARGGRWQEPMSSVTATPGGLTSRRIREHSRDPFSAKPISAIRTRADEPFLKAQSSNQASSSTSYGKSTGPNYMPSPAASAFTQESLSNRSRGFSRDHKPGNLTVDTGDLYIEPGLPTGFTMNTNDTTSSLPFRLHKTEPSPAITDSSSRNRSTTIEDYISSTQYHNEYESSGRRTESRSRAATDTRRYVKPSQKSPSSPISMSPDDPALKLSILNHRPLEVPDSRADEGSGSEAEKFYRITSPTGTVSSNLDFATTPMSSRPRGRSSSRHGRTRHESIDQTTSRHVSRSRPTGAESRSDMRSVGRDESRGRSSRAADPNASRRSPTSPVPMHLGYDEAPRSAKPRDQSVGARVRARERGTSQTRPRELSSDRHRSLENLNIQRSASAGLEEQQQRDESPPPRTASRGMSRTRRPSIPRLQTNFSESHADNRRTLAAQELEARRRSLARRPSAPVIMHPDDIASPLRSGYSVDITGSTQMSQMTNNDDSRSIRATGTSTSSVPIGLPSNPKVMQHGNMILPGHNNDLEDNGYYPSNSNPPTGGLPTLSATTFTPSRAASVPVERAERQQSRHGSRESITNRSQHSRIGSMSHTSTSFAPPPPPPAVVADEANVIGGTIHLEEDNHDSSAVVAELAHLNHGGQGSNMNHMGNSTPEAMHIPANTATLSSATYTVSSPTGVTNSTRRGRGSISSNTGQAEKARGLSRRREPSANRQNATRSPYESVPDSNSRIPSALPDRSMIRSPYESVNEPVLRTATAPPLGGSETLLGKGAYNPNMPSRSDAGGGLTLGSGAYNPSAQPQSQSQSQGLPSNTTGYRTPKEIAKAMAAQQAAAEQALQFGVNAERSYGGNSDGKGGGPMQTLTGRPF